MDPGVGGELGVERGGHHWTVTHRNRSIVDRREHLDVLADVVDERRPNEDGVERAREFVDGDLGLEGVLLSAERVAVDGDVDEPERVDPVVFRVARADDEAGTRRENRLSGGDVLAYLRGDTLAVKQA